MRWRNENGSAGSGMKVPASTVLSRRSQNWVALLGPEIAEQLIAEAHDYCDRQEEHDRPTEN